MTKQAKTAASVTSEERATLAAMPPGEPLLLAARPGPDLGAAGWTELEYVASGSATAFEAGVLPRDGRWELRPGAGAPYRTRVLVRRPGTAAFSGTLVVEWLNVSGGNDAAPDWTYLADELVRRGHAWAGVSAQFTGVEGGAAAVAVEGAGAPGLKGGAPERYATLAHPGDAFAFDIFRQVARTLRDGLEADVVLAAGASQSAAALTSYVNGVHPLARLCDGFLVHSRPGGFLPFGAVGAAPIGETLGGGPTWLREDLDVPVVVVQTEGDLFAPLDFLPARQPDHARLRTWEVAGSAHADKFAIGDFEEFLGCPRPVNSGQQAFVLRAALRHLDAWARGGPPPPGAPGLEIEGDGFAVDRHGNARGGVRTPVVEAPVQVLSGLPVPDASPVCRLFGSSEALTGVWASPGEYLAAYERATDAAIAAGFVLDDDRAAVLADARPQLVS